MVTQMLVPMTSQCIAHSFRFTMKSYLIYFKTVKVRNPLTSEKINMPVFLLKDKVSMLLQTQLTVLHY